MNQPPDDFDAMARAMKRSSRAPLWIALAVVIGLPALGGLWTLKSFAAARDDLEADGYTNPKVKIKGPFTFSFSATKGTSTCSGTITRYPGSSSREELCFDESPKAATPPPPSNREQVEGSLRKNYGKRGFDDFSCPEIANADEKASCTISAKNGLRVTVPVERTKVDADGSWLAWSSTLPAGIASGEELAADLTQSMGKTIKKKHDGLAVDCGKGPVMFQDGKLTCDVTTSDKTPVHTKARLTLNQDGGYRWAVDGL